MKRKKFFIESLSNMKPRQLAKFLEHIVGNGNCDRCIYGKGDDCTITGPAEYTCVKGITKWLKREI